MVVELACIPLTDYCTIYVLSVELLMSVSVELAIRGSCKSPRAVYHESVKNNDTSLLCIVN